MIRRRSIATVAAATLTATLLAACGGSDAKQEAAYISLVQAQGIEQVGDAFEVPPGGTTLGWQASAPGSEDKPTVLKITRQTGPCKAALTKPCPKDSRLREDVPAQEIELPADGAKRSGGIAITTLKPGRRVVVTAELCTDGKCEHRQQQTFRMAPKAAKK